MMNKYPSIGTLLQVSIASVLTTVAGLTSINFPNGEVQFWDATALDSTHVEDGELAGLSAPGECSGDGFYDPADTVQLAILGDIPIGGKYRDWAIVRPAPVSTDPPVAICSFNGSIKSFNPKAAVKDGLKLDWSVKLRTMAEYGAEEEDPEET
ncbi:phage tail tube protein [Planctomicrobium sp. SH527]|uniref:phage tail tube protein n=1 Tax=Planctomicrobium sp. SH527 TaxID=3448123 RepID=UPI003F5CA48E